MEANRRTETASAEIALEARLIELKNPQIEELDDLAELLELEKPNSENALAFEDPITEQDFRQALAMLSTKDQMKWHRMDLIRQLRDHRYSHPPQYDRINELNREIKEAKDYFARKRDPHVNYLLLEYFGMVNR